MVIPNDAKADILKELHVAHQGIERTKRRARETVYWPNIDKDIAQAVSSCDACRQRLPSQPKEEMLEDGQESLNHLNVLEGIFLQLEEKDILLT